MKTITKNTSATCLALFLTTLLCFTGCARTYVALLPNDDGSVGKISVTGPAGETVLEKASEAVAINGTADDKFFVTDEVLERDFGAALAASPSKPASFLLYFESGGANLTAASQADLPKILAEIGKRIGVDISIIGHTDTAGDARDNVLLGLTRARAVAVLLSDAKIDAEKVSVESHGETNLLIHTQDGVDEPMNRRVEVTVR